MATKQNRHFESKIKNAKKHAKNVSTKHCSCFKEKTARKNVNYSTKEIILKIGKNGHKAKAIALQTRHFNSNTKNAKKDAKKVSTNHCHCSMQKMARKNG